MFWFFWIQNIFTRFQNSGKFPEMYKTTCHLTKKSHYIIYHFWIFLTCPKRSTSLIFIGDWCMVHWTLRNLQRGLGLRGWMNFTQDVPSSGLILVSTSYRTMGVGCWALKFSSPQKWFFIVGYLRHPCGQADVVIPNHVCSMLLEYLPIYIVIKELW